MILPPVSDEAHRTAFLREVRAAYECRSADCDGSGGSIRAVAKLLGVSYATARRYVLLSGATLHRRGPVPRR